MARSSDDEAVPPDAAGRKGESPMPRPILDAAHLEAQVVGDHGLRLELLRLYAGRLIALAPAVCGAPCPQRREAAHALKGASLAIGAFALADICGAIESGDEGARAEAALAIEMTRRRVEDMLRRDW
jgi:hypothetical protein